MAGLLLEDQPDGRRQRRAVGSWTAAAVLVMTAVLAGILMFRTVTGALAPDRPGDGLWWPPGSYDQCAVVDRPSAGAR